MTILLFIFGFLAHPTFADSFFETRRVYSHELFETREGCMQTQPPGFFVNCAQTITFDTDGRAVVVLTDIANSARYAISGDTVVVTLSGLGDMPQQMRFVLTRTRRHLIGVGTSEVWEWRNN